MKKIYINFPSITFAIKAKKILSDNDITSDIVKTPSAFSPCGCGYSVTINHALKNQAKQLLGRYNIIYNDFIDNED